MTDYRFHEEKLEINSNFIAYFTPVDACSTTINYYELITGSKSAQ